MTKNKTLKRTCVLRNHFALCQKHSVPACLSLAGFSGVAVLVPPWLSRSYPSPSLLSSVCCKVGLSPCSPGVVTVSLPPPAPPFPPFQKMLFFQRGLALQRHLRAAQTEGTWPYLRRQISVKVKSHGGRKENLLRFCDPVCLL